MAESPQHNDTSKASQQRPPERRSVFNSVAADIVGGILTAVSSVGAAVLMIDKNFFRNAEKEKRFEKFHRLRDAERASPATTALKGHEWLARVREIEQQHEKNIVGELKEMGITGPIEKFRSLRAHQKKDVAWTVGAVTVGAIGLVSTIIGNRISVQKEHELVAKLDSLDDTVKTGQSL